MANSLSEILSGKAAKNNEPPEFPIIREYVIKNFQVTPKLSVSNKQIVITVPSAAVAGSLRLSIYELRDLCKTKQRLFIRIGQ